MARKTSVSVEPSRWLGDPITRKVWTPIQLEAWCRGQVPPPTLRPPIVRPTHYPPPPPPNTVPKKVTSGDLLPLKDPFATPRPGAVTASGSPYDTDLLLPYPKKKPAKRTKRGTFAGDLCPPNGPCKTPTWKDPSPPRKRPKAGPFRDALCDPFDKPGCGVPKRTGVLKCDPFSTPRACPKNR